MYQVLLTKQAMKDREKVLAAGLGERAKAILTLLKSNPFQNPPPYEKLTGNLKGFLSRRLNRQHRVVYTVDQQSKQVRVLRMWTHYE